MISPKKLYHLLREHPDTSTPQGRSRDRYRRAALTSATMVISRFLNLGVGFLTMPIVARYLGGDLFGLWMLLTGFISVLVFADLGIGIGFQNHLIRCYSENDRQMPSVWVTNTLVLMILLCLIVVAISLWVIPLLPLEEWLRFEDPASIPWLIPSAQALGISFAIGLPATMFQYIGNAYQRGYWPQLIWMVGRLISLVGLVVAAWCEQPLPVLIAIFIAPPYLLQLLGLGVLWCRTSLFRPAWCQVRFKLIRSLFKLGGGFLVNRITHALQMQGPGWVVAAAFTVTEAGYVAAAMKIFQLGGIFYQPLVPSLYPALGEAVHRNDWKWVSRVIHQLVTLQLICNVITMVVVLLFGNWLLTFLLDQSPSVPLSVFVALGLHMFAIGLVMIPATVLNAMNHLRYQLFYRTLFSIIPFGVAALLCRHGAGVGTVLFGFVLTGIVPFLIAACIDFTYYKKQRTGS